MRLPSGHFVSALPRNLSVIALILVGFVTLRLRVPRSIAVLRSDESDCSKPCKKSTGSVSVTPTLTPFPDASGLSSAKLFTLLLIMLFTDDLADDRWLSTNAGRGPPTALRPMEPLGVDLMSPVATDHLLLSLSGGDALGELALFVEDRGVAPTSVNGGGFAKRESMKDLRKRLALSRGPASFSNM